MKKLLFIIILMTVGLPKAATAQETNYEEPNWYFGAAAGANFNFYRGTTQQLNSGLVAPAGFHEGEGIGLYVAPLVEYHFTNSVWGIMFQAGYDNRKGKWDQEISSCNCPLDLSSQLSYVSVEPSLRLAPFKSSLYFYAGPRFAFTLDKSFSYQKGDNPERNEDFDQMESNVISMQIGAGYDIPLSPRESQSQFILSPFVSFQPYLGQYPRSTESWNITTVRIGAALKFGRGSKISPQVMETQLPEINFSIDSPANHPVEGAFIETFPLSNYVFFNQGSTEIPNRYVLINKDETEGFSEEQIEADIPLDFEDRSERGITVYYNILNILGDRMGKNPLSRITLVGSSIEGPENGKAMAASIKKYLVDIFSIEENRIATEGRTEPKILSGQPHGNLELELLIEENRRVSIESNSPALLMEFQNGPNKSLKSVTEISSKAPVDSYVSFEAEGANEAFISWKLQFTDNNEKVQNFGPYTQEVISIPGEAILGDSSEGDFKVTMIGTTPSGDVIREESTVTVVKWTPAEISEAMRFSILFEFDNPHTISIYEKYLSEVVATKIPQNALVVIHGYTDIVGQKERNKELSLARANNVKDIIQDALLKTNRTDVTFDVHGSGEEEVQSPFKNDLPEERVYNRTVIIDLRETI